MTAIKQVVRTLNFIICIVIFLSFILSAPATAHILSLEQDTSQVKLKRMKSLPDSVLSDSTGVDSILMLKKNVLTDSSNLFIEAVPEDYSKLDLQIIIEHGEQYTKKRAVALEIIAPKALEMKIGNVAELDNAAWRPFQQSLNWDLAAGDGYQMVYAQVRYPDSSLSRIVYDEIILDSTPPRASFTVFPDSGTAGETLFTFDATMSTHNFELFLRWDWDGDGNYDTDWTVSKQAGYTYPVGGGKKKAILEVKDSGGWVASATKTITVYSRPKAACTYVQDFRQPLKVTLDGSISEDFEESNYLLYRWDLNSDSTWDSGWNRDKKFEQEYELFNRFPVTLEVKDTQGLVGRTEMMVINQFLNMVYVPEGSFSMGVDGFDIDERPVHDIFVDEFWIDIYPVTNAQYARFLNDYLMKYPEEWTKTDRFIKLVVGESAIELFDNQYVANKDFKDHPVVHVSWYGADAYARFYNKRLPTEAEWEKSARGTDGRTYPWGNVMSGESANFWDSGDPFDNGTTPVGFYNGETRNGFKTENSVGFYGTYDMAGNVREWVGDWYQRDFYSTSPQQNPAGPASGTKKVARGGGYLFLPDDLRTTYRYSLPPDKATNFVGFRCVKSK
ncbi:MAG: formylglycine-generating enzyme family protein [Candidatus Zhuqueibacterota bacterium]